MTHSTKIILDFYRKKKTAKLSWMFTAEKNKTIYYLEPLIKCLFGFDQKNELRAQHYHQQQEQQEIRLQIFCATGRQMPQKIPVHTHQRTGSITPATGIFHLITPSLQTRL